MSNWTPCVSCCHRRLRPGLRSWGTFPPLVLTLPLPTGLGTQSPGFGQGWPMPGGVTLWFWPAEGAAPRPQALAWS